MSKRGRRIEYIQWALTNGIGLVYTAVHTTVLAIYILLLTFVLFVISWWEKIR